MATSEAIVKYIDPIDHGYAVNYLLTSNALKITAYPKK
jgi:hypothetical protein